MLCGVSQGSNHGALLLNLHLVPFCEIFQELVDKLSYHSYADDTQIYLTMSLCLCPKNVNNTTKITSNPSILFHLLGLWEFAAYPNWSFSVHLSNHFLQTINISFRTQFYKTT